ncbi:hypothetical protein AAVH_32813, partial [Aphelenchoides avenae]
LREPRRRNVKKNRIADLVPATGNGRKDLQTDNTAIVRGLRGGNVEKKTARGVPSRGGGGGGQPTRGRGANNKFGTRRGQGKRGQS